MLVVLEFTQAFSQIPAEDFVRTVLVDGVHARHAAMGANFTFGYKAAGTVATLPEMGAPYGLTAEGVPLFELGGRTVSSSSIRDALAAGDLTWPAEALGRRFVLDGEVISGHGRGQGARLPDGEPADLAAPDAARTGDLRGRGRYSEGGGTGPRSTSARTPRSAWSRCTSRRSCSISRATSSAGEPLAIEFWERLRDEIRYESIDELIAAIADDVERTRAIVPDDQLDR